MLRQRLIGAACLGVLLAAGAMSAGCEGTNKPTMDRTGEDRWYGYPADDHARKSTPAPAPAPKAEAPAPQPQPRPAPAPAPRMGSSVMYLPTGERATSAVMIERTSPGEVSVGQNFTYDIIVTNLTDMSLNSVLLTDQPSSNFKFVSADPQAKQAANGVLSWELGNLPGRQSRTVRVTGNAASAGTISHCCELAYNNALCQTINVVQPALRIAKTITPADITVCETATVKIDVTNNGTGAARNVRVRDPLPDGMTTADGRNVAEFDAGTLAGGQTRSFTFPVKVSKTGNFSNKAMATAEGNLSAESQAVALKATKPVLEAKAECPPALLMGRNGTVKFTITNKGDAACKNTTFRAAVPSGVTFVSADNNGAMAQGAVTWNLGEVAPGASRTVSMTLRTSGAGQVSVSGTASCVCAEAVTAACTFGVQGTPDIGAQLIDADGVVLVGDNHTYTYEVVNQGQVNLTNVRTTVTLPAELDYVSSTAQPQPRIDGKKLEFAVGTLTPGQKKVFTFTVRANKAGEVSVQSETFCDQLRNATRDDEITVFVDR